MSALDGPRWGPANGGAARQLVVLCHGLGADGFDLIDLAPGWGAAVPEAVFAAPHAPHPCDLGPTGRQWFSVADRRPPRMEAGVREAAQALDGFLDAELARLGLPPDAYALMGFSQGAMTVLFAGLRRPVAPRAILAYSGGLIAPETLPAELRNRAPVLLVHGTDDDAVPIARSRLAEQALRQAAVPVETLWCPGLGHGIDAAGISIGGLALQRAFAG